MLKPITWSAAALTVLIGVDAVAQTASPGVAPPDPPWTVVAPEERLTLVRVFFDADPVMKLVMGGLLLSALLALGLWLVQAARLRSGRTDTFAGAVAYLSALAAAGPLIGFFGSAYTLLSACIGLSNVRPAPSISIIAPGLAEALLSAMLGLLAASIAVIGHRHLKARLYSAGIEADEPSRETMQTLPRQSRAPA